MSVQQRLRKQLQNLHDERRSRSGSISLLNVQSKPSRTKRNISTTKSSKSICHRKSWSICRGRFSKQSTTTTTNTATEKTSSPSSSFESEYLSTERKVRRSKTNTQLYWANCIGYFKLAGEKLVLSDIYQWILDNYTYFHTRGSGWRNSIRHNLSLNDCFMKSGRSANGKGHYWTIHPANLEDFSKGDFRRRRAQRRVRKSLGLTVPEEDEEDDDILTPPSSLSPVHQKIYTNNSRIINNSNNNNNNNNLSSSSSCSSTTSVDKKSINFYPSSGSLKRRFQDQDESDW